ncbi:hypothetical protein [Bacillus sp. MRMR6]|uniref:hypothetical protein n=1 Tax=Bacillus sp. MRMR6 TaxID=1928617 RepID=UPI000952555E|nr:hypothetical protein [Bacillus sp. MRMR6]OLS41693.1 hypothetical protein BTR25_03870 [Bacillus sp. MRMR6]
MKKLYMIFGLFIIFFLAVSVQQYMMPPKVQESITFFPIDPKVTYKKAETNLELIETPAQTLNWKASSTLDRKAYLRQDASLLYSNGRLVSEFHDWKQNSDTIIQEKQISMKGSALLQAVTFHHAELHEKKELIFSSQTMSEHQLYIILLNSEAKSFITPESLDEKEWKQKLDEQTERMLQLSWNKGVGHYSIKLDNYQAFPLSEFNRRSKESLSGFSKSETARVVGNLWEGLYKNYLLGIKKADGTIESPIGSTIPLILVSNDKSHLLALTETAKGEPILLRQLISDTD